MNVRFYAKFLLHMILPIASVVVVSLAYFLVVTCVIKRDNLDKLMHVKETASKVIIVLVLLLYPGLST